MSEIRVEWAKSVPSSDEAIHRWINLGNGTMYRIGAFFVNDYQTKLFIGIEKVGCFSFNFPSIGFDKNYINEKLTIRNDSDSAIIADWINAQFQVKCHQQGKYTENFILENEPFALIGERQEIPLCPEIITE